VADQERGQSGRLNLPAQALIYEGFVTFFGEFSVILARAADGSIQFWDSAENVHVNGILDTSTVPASDAIAAQVLEARALAQKVAEALDYVGALTLEFFATDDGPVFNEMAPRVQFGPLEHRGAITSQFENHIRAVCGLPLGLTTLAVPGARMTNLIGDDAHDWLQILSDPANHLHLYGRRRGPDARWAM
jgi:5-(carboxyamino)imidazole ribonucleotide synthase